MASTISMDGLLDWLGRFDEHTIEQRARLTSLDRAIGDADHGLNITRGMRAVSARVDAVEPNFVDDLFRTAGYAMTAAVSGFGGTLIGSFFLAFGEEAGHVVRMDAPAFARALRAGTNAVAARGGVSVGHKTMLDALEPGAAAFESATGWGRRFEDCADAASTAAQNGLESTETLVATRGRASERGDSSIGHLDPGATTVALLFQALAESQA
jgi:dihydroxyacetone kinase-like protein